MAKEGYEYGDIQKLLVRICFFFKGINIDIRVQSDCAESVQLLMPKN